MRRVANAAVVAALVAVVAAAALDAVRPGPPPVERPDDELRALGAEGQILLSDASCARLRLLLPSLELSEIRRIVGCDVFGHRGSLGIVRGELGWYAYPGGVTVLLTRRQLEREVAGGRIVAAAWLENTRYAALVEQPGRERRLLGLFAGDRLVRRVAELDGDFRELRSSPRGGLFAALDRGGGLAVYDARGEEVQLPASVERPHAIAWSRDDRLAVVADARGLLVFPTQRARPESVRLALQARDLAWR